MDRLIPARGHNHVQYYRLLLPFLLLGISTNNLCAVETARQRDQRPYARTERRAAEAATAVGGESASVVETLRDRVAAGPARPVLQALWPPSGPTASSGGVHRPGTSPPLDAGPSRTARDITPAGLGSSPPPARAPAAQPGDSLPQIPRPIAAGCCSTPPLPRLPLAPRLQRLLRRGEEGRGPPFTLSLLPLSTAATGAGARGTAAAAEATRPV